MLNVLLIAGSARFSTRDVWDGYRIALEESGVHVVPYSTFAFLQLLSVDAVCNDIIGTALDQSNRFDYVIFIDGLYFRGQRARVPQSIRRAGVPTVLIATDDPYESVPQTETLYTHRFSNERRGRDNGVEYLPTATLIPPRPLDDLVDYDLSFVGTVFEDRLPVLRAAAEHCERHQRRFLIAGKLLGQEAIFSGYRFTDLIVKTIPPDLKWHIYSRSTLTLNLFRQSDKPTDSPNPRVFEVTAFGRAALLTGPHRSEVEEIYGDRIFTFPREADLNDLLDQAWATPADVRDAKVEAARQITLDQHTYHHRASELVAHLTATPTGHGDPSRLQHQTAWLIGCGRTGSTWLSEMLGDLPSFRRWHEPYFGRFFKHLQDRPDDVKRSSSFFSERGNRVWIEGLRKLFYEVAMDRFPNLGEQTLIVKEVNTPEYYHWIAQVFPHSKLVLLVRDPYDILDSYLALQQPGSWNQSFRDAKIEPLSQQGVRRTAKHIEQCLTLALAAFDAFPQRQRLWLTYESLLEDPAEGLRQLGDLMDRPLQEADLSAVIERHRFENYKQTGPLAFRRQGQASKWKQSPNFTGEVRQWAGEILHDLRSRMGYD